ncbi:MAG TPA: hypothetical protein VLW88_09550 [Hyphomicrobium sp.]|jgi:hypothetical protein|nr:hypothetical protein [Hyphomicrobium sp.]
MADTSSRDICKAEVDRFLFGKHITACPVCGRFRNSSDVDVHALTCQRASCSDPANSAPLDVLMIVCTNCGAIQFHDRAVIAQWLECQKRVKVR